MQPPNSPQVALHSPRPRQHHPLPTVQRSKLIGHCRTCSANQLNLIAFLALSALFMFPIQAFSIEEIGHLDLQGNTYDVAVRDGYAYVANDFNGLRIVDISNPAEPSEVASLDTPGEAWQVNIDGEYAYVADMTSGMRIIDISNPEQPREVGAYDSPGSTKDVFVVGDLAYLADDGSGTLRIIDISDRTRPRLISSIQTEGYAYGVTVNGDFAYLGADWGGLHIIDVSDPSNPRLIGSLDTPGRAWAVTVIDGIAYIADMQGGFRIADVSDPAHPREIASVPTPGVAWNLIVEPPFAYVGCNNAGLMIVQISDPSDPIVIDIVETPGNAMGIALSQSNIYLADYAAGLRIFDRSHVETLIQLRQVSAVNIGSALYSVDVSGSYVYAGASIDGLKIFDVTDIERPSLAATFDTQGWAQGVTILDSYLYLAEFGNNGGLRVFNVAQPVDPEAIGFAEVPSRADDLFVQGNHAYIGASDAGLQIIDVSDPTDPTIVSSYNTPGLTGGVIVQDGIAYVADWESGLQVVDVSAPDNPRGIGACDLPGARANDLRILGHFAFVTGLEGGLYIVDITDPSNPTLTGRGGSSYAVDVDVEGNFAFVSDEQEGVVVFDVSDPTDPFRVAYSHTARVTQGIEIWGDYAYVAGHSSGLEILDVTGFVPSIAISAQEIEYGAVVIGNATEYQLTISNDGGVPLQISNITIEGEGFGVDFGGGTQLDSHGELQQAITFTPPDTGRFEGVLSISSNDQDDGEVELPIRGRGVITHPIPLRSAWNIISSQVRPDDSRIPTVWQNLRGGEHLIITKDQAGRFYVPAIPFCNIASWDVRQGYWAKLSEADTLNVLGYPVAVDTPLPLRQGWSIVAYFPEEEISAQEAFEGLGDAFLMAKDARGRFYRRALGYSNMGSLKRDEGYQVSVSQDIDLIWNIPQGNQVRQYSSPEQPPSHFISDRQSGPNMSILIEPPGFDGEIAVFSMNGKCLGAATVYAEQRVGIAVFGTEPDATSPSGASEGDALYIRLWNGQKESTAEFTWLEGEGVYHMDGFAWGNLVENRIPAVFDFSPPSPNPFNSTTVFRYQIPEAGVVSLFLYDMAGRQKERLFEGAVQAGAHELTWTAAGLPSGLYMARLSTAEGVRTQKLILLK